MTAVPTLTGAPIPSGITLPPLTAPWTAPATCLFKLWLADHDQGYVYLDDNRERNATKEKEICYPPGMFDKGAGEYLGRFSPANCPTGWTTNGVYLYGSATGAVCCSSRYTLDAWNYCASPIANTVVAVVSGANTGLSTVTSKTLRMSPITALWEPSDLALLASLTSFTSSPTSRGSISISTTARQPGDSSTVAENSANGIPLGAKVGVGVGVAVAVIIIVAAIITLFCFRRRRKTSVASVHDASAELPVEVAEPKVYQLSGVPVVPELDSTMSPGAAARGLELEGLSPVNGGLLPHEMEGHEASYGVPPWGSLRQDGAAQAVPVTNQHAVQGPNSGAYMSERPPATSGDYAPGTAASRNSALERLREEKTRLEAKRQRLLEIEETEAHQREIQRQIDELEREKGGS